MLPHFHVHLLQCLGMGPKPLQERVRHKVRSSASSFSFQYLFSSLKSASSCLRLLLFLLIPSILPSLTCFKKTDCIGLILHSNRPFPCKSLILDFELSPFGWFPSVWILYADVSEHSLFHLHRRCTPFTPPMRLEQTGCSETSAYKIQTSGNYPKEIIQVTYCSGNDTFQNIYLFVVAEISIHLCSKKDRTF
jgi:hypothetical protein